MTSRTYADILKQQFSLKPMATTTTNDNNWPPRKCQATVIDYNLDQTESQSITTAVASTNSTNNSPSSSSNLVPPSTATKTEYVTDLQLLKNEIQVLRTLLTHTVEQIKNEIASIRTPPVPGAMEIDATQSQNPHQNTSHLLTYHHSSMTLSTKLPPSSLKHMPCSNTNHFH